MMDSVSIPPSDSIPESIPARWVRPAVILVATDLSDLDKLMPHALSQAALTGARLILLHVIAAGNSLSIDNAGISFYDPSTMMESAGKALKPCSEAARQRGIACDSLLREGNVAEQIVSAVRQFQVDRIILGTRSKGKLEKLLLGSVAEQVLRSVNLPVMTVGPEAHLPVEESGRQPVVLHATTLRETSRPSAALACQVAASQGAKLLLLHVLPPIDEMERKGLPTGLESTALHELRLLAAETGAHCCSCVEPLVVHGNPHIEILAGAAEQHADLIVLGSTDRSSFENLTRDRVVLRVLAHARCPVLTLRTPSAKAAEAVGETISARG
jgi:nucleotide-binding universal stress UspA family protein